MAPKVLAQRGHAVEPGDAGIARARHLALVTRLDGDSPGLGIVADDRADRHFAHRRKIESDAELLFQVVHADPPVLLLVGQRHHARRADGGAEQPPGVEVEAAVGEVPAAAPRATPTVIATAGTASATESEMRPPSNTRTSWSRPNSSVPKGRASDGDRLLAANSIRSGSQGMSAGPAITLDELEALRETVERRERAYHANDLPALRESAVQFHRLLRAGARNGRLPELVALLFDAHRSLGLHEMAPERVEAAIGEHRVICGAVSARDADLAEQLTREHARNALRAQILAHYFAE